MTELTYPMSRRRPKRSAANTKSEPDQIPEDEQWRHINESKILQQITTPGTQDEEEEDSNVMCIEVFNATLFIIPFSFLLLLMDM